MQYQIKGSYNQSKQFHPKPGNRVRAQARFIHPAEKPFIIPEVFVLRGGGRRYSGFRKTETSVI